MAGSITHFSITELPDPNIIDSKINGVGIALNTLYPIANQSLLSFERKPEFNNIALLTKFKWKTHDNVNNISSNVANGNLSWIGISADPLSVDVNQVINNLDVVNLLDILPLNDTVEFIDIISMTGVFELKLNGNLISVGQRLKTTDLLYTIFTALSEGGGNPYFLLVYKVGNSNEITPVNYSLQLNIVSAAILSILFGPSLLIYNDDFDNGGIITNYTVKEESFIVEVSSGHAFGTAELTITINSDFLSLNAYNNVSINFGSQEFEEYENIVINAILELDKFGNGNINIKNFIVMETNDPAIGNINIQLNSINNDPGLVSGSQILQLLTNL